MNSIPEWGRKPARLHYFDHIRNFAMLCVVLYHSVIAYGTVTGHFPFHDTNPVLIADIVRWLFDVFMMPVFFFVAGYFTLGSLMGKGPVRFLGDKFRRLILPWALVLVGIIVPMVWGNGLGYYFREGIIGGPGDKLLEIMRNFLRFRSGRLNEPQMHLWFLPVLFAFFAISVSVCMLVRAGGGKMVSASRPSEFICRHRFEIIIAAGIVLSVIYYLVIRNIREINIIFHVGPLSFEPAKLPLNAGAFMLGIYFSVIDRRKAKMSWEKLPFWWGISIMSAACFFVFGKQILAASAVPADLPEWRILAFSISRTFLSLSILILLIIYSKRYFNIKTSPGAVLSANSFNIYIIHMFPVLGLQAALINWENGPAWIKILIVFCGALFISYLLSRFIVSRFPKATAVFLVLVFTVFAVMFNPHGYEKKFIREQEHLKKESTQVTGDYQNMKRKALELYYGSKESRDSEILNAFRAMSIVHYMNEYDYEVQACLADLTVISGCGKSLPVHMVHDVIGYAWMDEAVAGDPGNLNIRMIRGLDSYSKPDVFAGRWSYAEIDFKYIIKHAADNDPREEALRRTSLQYLGKIAELEKSGE